MCGTLGPEQSEATVFADLSRFQRCPAFFVRRKLKRQFVSLAHNVETSFSGHESTPS
jgi:hypothetical protein